MKITTDGVLADLRKLVAARGPGGQEEEVAAVCRKRLEGFCDEVFVDAAGSLVGFIKGKSREPGVKVLAHMDENCLYVKRIEQNGRLSVRPIGGIKYWRFGDGPVEVLDDAGKAIPGVLGRGCRHTAENAAEKAADAGAAPTWEQAYVETRLSKAQLDSGGIHPGSRVVIGRSRRELFFFEDCVAGLFLDDRAGIAAMCAAGERLEEDGAPPSDVYLVCTTEEENGGGTAAFTVQSLPGSIALAVETLPAAPEYDIPLDAVPVIVVKDANAVYTRSVCLRLADAAGKAGTGHRFAALERLASDASCSRKSGSAMHIGCVGFPTDNTHGFEVCLPQGIANCAELLRAYLRSPVGNAASAAKRKR